MEVKNTPGAEAGVNISNIAGTSKGLGRVTLTDGLFMPREVFVGSPEGYTTIESVPGADAGLPNAIVELLDRVGQIDSTPDA